MILLDTSVVLAAMGTAPDPRVLAWLDSHDPEVFGIPAVVLAELHHGLQRAVDSERKHVLLPGFHKLAREVCRGAIIPFDEKAALVFGRLMAERDRARRPMGIAACQIAAIALANSARLATQDGDFADCGIVLIDPWAEL
jgi:toxin FitB